jgi:hypothetical protein
MAELIHKGFFEALLAGDLTGAPDVRCRLVMSATTCDTESLAHHLDDFTTIDEFDGVGYTELDAASVTCAYVDGDLEIQLNFTDPASFGDPVAPGSDIIQGMLVYLYVDGTTPNDVALAYTDQGGFGGNAANGSVTLTLATEGLLFVRQA